MAYWQGRQLVLHDYRSGHRLTATPLVLDILDAFGAWRPLERATARVPGARPRQVAALVEALARLGLLERSDLRGARGGATDAWTTWNPAAGFFHGATRDVAFWPREDANAFLSRKAESTPPPPAVTSSARDAHAFVALRPPDVTGELRQTLRARRTWRRFGTGRVSADALATLLGLTWGVQAWVDVARFGRIPLKTSPSGGARHSIEAHVVVRRVAGIPAGVYHYDSGAHALVRRGGRVSAADLRAFAPHQAWMAGAGAIVFMTSVFARVQWRYPFARAYRTVLAEAGHHAQTFCLLATSLGLAPFCTMALADTRVEDALGVDGVREAVMYAVGVGTVPRGVAWAPWPGRRPAPARLDLVPGADAAG